MLTSNSMRFCTDVFGVTQDGDDGAISVAAFQKKALLISKTAWNCTKYVSVDSFVINGTQPENTDRRFLFKIDDANYKFNGTSLVKYTGKLDVDSVLANGNTAAQLAALTNISGFVGKKIFPIIAIESHATNGDAPTVKLQLKATAANDVLTDVQESIVYELTDDDSVPTITECVADTTLEGNGTVTAQIRLRKNNVWSDYMELTDAVDKEAEAVQVKATYKVKKTDGTDSATLNFVAVEHTYGKAIVAGKNANLYSQVVDYENDLSMCYTVVKHEPLKDSYIEAYVNFMKPPKTRGLTVIGTGNGSRQEFILGVDGVPDEKIDTTSITLYQDGVELSDYSYNSASSTVTLVTVKNATYTATYKYNHGVEEWRKMTLEEQEPMSDGSGIISSRFSYGFDSTGGMSTANVRLHLVRRSGTVSNTTSLGPATGKMQMRVLNHPAKESTIKFAESGVEWSFDPDTNIISYVAKKNSTLTFSYSWVGENIVIYSWVTGFTVA